MKLINYNYGYTPASQGSEWYRGKILMTYDEWRKVKSYLMRARLGASYENKFLHDLLKKDIEKNIASVRGGGFHVIIRVTATEKLVEKYNLKNYKRQNYFVHVVPQ